MSAYWTYVAMLKAANDADAREQRGSLPLHLAAGAALGGAAGATGGALGGLITGPDGFNVRMNDGTLKRVTWDSDMFREHGTRLLENPKVRAAWRGNTARYAGWGAGIGAGLGLGAGALMYSQQKQAAAVPVLPHALAHPYQFVEQDTGGPTLQGAGWGAGLGALAGGALGSMSHVHTGLGGAALGALAGGILGGSIGHSMKVEENWGLHRQAVRDWEAEHGPLPYDISHARNVRQLQRLKGEAAGLAADTLISGSITGISDRDYYGRRGYGYGRGTSTYGMGHSMGAAYGNLSAQDQVGRAVAEYQRELANQRGRR